MIGAKSFTLDTAARLVFVFFFLPFLVYALTAARMGDVPYRAVDVLHAGALGLTAYLIARHDRRLRLSSAAKGFSLFLVVNMIAVLISSFTEYRPEVVPAVLIQTTILFVVILLSFDLLSRRYSFEEFCELASPIALLLIVISAYHVQFQSVRIWGRALYFNLHPNVGGEVLFGAMAVGAFNPRASLRWLGYGLGMFALMQIQSRAAEIAAIALVAGCEIPRTTRGLSHAIVGGIAAVAALCVGLLLNPDLADGLYNFVKEDMLKTSDPYRGEGTGLVGRADTWIMAFDKMAQRPLFGTGVNQSGITVMGIGVHNGYIKNMAEFGVPGAFVNAFIIVGVGLAALKDWRRGVVLGACAILFFFNARSINLMVFPLLMYIALMPWAPPRSQASQPAPLFGFLGAKPRPASAPILR